MKLSVYRRQYEVNKSISSVWEAVRDFSGYSDRRISNISKENEDTLYFTYYFEKRRFSRIISPIISGRVYSKDDSLTKIEIRSGSILYTVIIILAYFALILASSFVSGVFPNMIIRVLLMTCVVLAFTFIHNREAKLNMDEFIMKLHLKYNIIDKENATNAN